MTSVSAAENEFLAEETLIMIIASIDHPLFRFISGDFGPLVSGLPCMVPLWLALTLRKRGMCSITIPRWMEVANLEKSLASERVESFLTPLPFNYIEISQLLLNHSKDQIKSPDQTAVLIQDLEQVRMDRLSIGMLDLAKRAELGSEMPIVNLNDISSMEISSISKFLCSSITVFNWLSATSSSFEASVDERASESRNRRLRRYQDQES